MIREVLDNKHLVLALVFLTVQQVIVASSTYFIAKLAKSLSEGQISSLYIILFASSLIVVYIPAYYCVTNIDRAKYDAHKLYNDNFDSVFKGKTSLFSNDSLKSSATSTLAQESNYTLSSIIDSIYDISALVLNILLNVLVITWFLDSLLLVGYIVGIILASIFVHLRRKSLETAAKNDQISRLSLMSKLIDSWDNVVLFNHHNYSIYQRTVEDSFNQAKENSVKSEAIRHINSSLGMVILMLPVFIVTAYIFNRNWSDATVLAVLVATLPRQIQLLQMCYQLVSHYTNLGIIKTMLLGISDILKPSYIDLDTYIQAEKIRVKQTGEIFDPENLPEQGRITLIGNNGVGKSSALLKLKEHYQDQAYYLPAKHNLYFNYTDDQVHKGSTGQQIIRQIEEIRESDQSSIIMLDEWDANLDLTNTEIIDRYLNEIALTKLVIDIRH